MSTLAVEEILQADPVDFSTNQGDNEHSFDLNLTNYLFPAYRIKDWLVTATVTFLGETKSWTSFTFAGSYTNELELRAAPQYAEIVGQAASTGIGSLTIKIFDAATPTNAVGWFAPFYYPRIHLSGSVQHSEGFTLAWIQETLGEISPFAARWNVGGSNLNFTMKITTVPTGLTSYNASIIVKPNSYWPYDPGDGGGPIYNSTTGAQLRSPYPPL